MSEWYVLLAFVAGVCFGQHITIRAVERAHKKWKNNYDNISHTV